MSRSIQAAILFISCLFSAPFQSVDALKADETYPLQSRIEKYRNLQSSFVCPPATTQGVADYNAVLHIDTEYTASCSSSESAAIESFVQSMFDSSIISDPNLSSTFSLDTDFCVGSSGNGSDDEDDDDYDDDDDGDRRLRGLRRLSSKAKANVNVKKRDERKLSLYVRIFRGSGKCILCNPDTSDRRRLDDDDTFLNNNVISLETHIASQLTTDVQTQYNGLSGHCLEGLNPVVEVTLFVATVEAPTCNQPLFCCAPSGDDDDECSSTAFGGNLACNTSPSECNTACNGRWINAEDD